MKSATGLLAAAAFILLMSPNLRAEPVSIAGNYTLVAERSSDIAAAIETAVAKMGFVKRPIARGRLKKTNPAYQQIAISRSTALIQVAFDGRAPIQMPADGSPVKWKRDDGEFFDVSASWQGTQLIQKFKAEDGERSNTFRSSADGGEMVLDVTISSEQLPTPLTYTLTYRRM